MDHERIEQNEVGRAAAEIENIFKRHERRKQLRSGRRFVHLTQHKATVDTSLDIAEHIHAHTHTIHTPTELFPEPSRAKYTSTYPEMSCCSVNTVFWKCNDKKLGFHHAGQDPAFFLLWLLSNHADCCLLFTLTLLRPNSTPCCSSLWVLIAKGEAMNDTPCIHVYSAVPVKRCGRLCFAILQLSLK